MSMNDHVECNMILHYFGKKICLTSNSPITITLTCLQVSAEVQLIMSYTVCAQTSQKKAHNRSCKNTLPTVFI